MPRQTLDEIFPRAAAVDIALGGATAAGKDGRGTIVGGICQGNGAETVMIWTHGTEKHQPY